MAAKKSLVIDPRSADVALEYVGAEDVAARHVPARDLTHNDIARMAYVRAIAAVGGDVGQPIDPEDPDAGVIERPDHKTTDQVACLAIVDELVATGKWILVKGLKVDEPETPTDTPAPVVPVTSEPEA